MTDNSVIPSFGLSSARPDTVGERVGDGQGLRRTQKVQLRLGRRSSGEFRFNTPDIATLQQFWRPLESVIASSSMELTWESRSREREIGPCIGSVWLRFL